MRKSLFLAVVLLLISALLLPTAAQAESTETYRITVLDTAKFFTTNQVNALTAERSGNTHGVAFYLVTSPTRLSSTRVNALCGLGGRAAVVLVIDETNGNYYYEAFTFNGAEDLLSSSAINRTLDANSVYNNIKNGSLQAGASAFFALCRQEIAAAVAAENAFPWYAVIAGLIGGVLVGGITVLCVFLSYRKKRHGVSYPLDRYAQMDLIDCQDRFVGSFVTRVRVQNSNAGGGRSGGRGGFSGGSRGRR